MFASLNSLSLDCLVVLFFKGSWHILSQMVSVIKFIKFQISLCLNIKINFQFLGNEKQLRSIILISLIFMTSLLFNLVRWAPLQSWNHQIRENSRVHLFSLLPNAMIDRCLLQRKLLKVKDWISGNTSLDHRLSCVSPAGDSEVWWTLMKKGTIPYLF